MKRLEDTNMGFFLTASVPLSTWEEMGILSREVAPYNILADHFRTIYVFTHGDKSEYTHQKHFKENVEIVPNPTRLRGIFYTLALPFMHRHVLKQCGILKTNQMPGSFALVLAKIFVNRHARIIVRTGYQLSFVMKRKRWYIRYFFALLLEFIVYKMCDKSLVTSRQMKDAVLKRYKLPRNKVVIVPNYIDTDLFSPEEPQRKRTNRVLYVGRLIPQKNIPLLVRALAGTNIGLDIVGDRPTHEGIQKTAETLGVSVRFLPHRMPNAKIPAILNQYEIFVLPSKWEGMPKTLLEAMSCGLACVGTNVAGTKEIIRHGETGLLAEQEEENIRMHITRLANDTKLRHTLGENARAFVITHFSLNEGVKKEIGIYKEVA